MNTPPPLPPEPDRKSIFQQAATACLVAPGIAIFVNFAWHITKGASPPQRSVVLIIGTLAFLLFVSGFTLAIAALLGIRRHGKRNLLSRGVAGLIINGLLLFIFVTNFTTARNRAIANKQARGQVESATSALVEEGIRSLEADGTIKDPAGQMEKYRKQLAAAGQNATGEDKLVMEAMHSFAAKFQLATQKYEKSAKALGEIEPVNFATLKQKDQIAARRSVVEQYIAANSEFVSTISNQAGMIQSELQIRGLKPEKIEKLVAAYRKETAASHELVLQIRQCDAQSGKVFLALLDLTETQWGKWTHNSTEGYTVFDDEASADQFEKLCRQLENVFEQQAQVQSKFIELQKVAAQKLK
jgi:hypothetical protein